MRAFVAMGLGLFTCFAGEQARAETFVVTTTVSSGPAVELERAAVRIGQVVVFTLGDILAEARLLLIEEGGTALANRVRFGPDELREVLEILDTGEGSGPLLELADLMASVLAAMVHRALLRTEARRLELRPATEAEVLEAFRELRARVPRRSTLPVALEEAGFGRARSPSRPPPRLADVLRADIEVERMIRFRRGPLDEIPAEEVEDCLSLRAEDLGVELQAASAGLWRETVAAAMEEARLSRGLEELLKQLSRRVEVVYAPPFRSRPLPEIPACPSPRDIRSVGSR